MAGLFVTGTDTGVGKTLVTAGLAATWRRQGIDAGVMKPVETGWDGPPAEWPPDAAFLVAAARYGDILPSTPINGHSRSRRAPPPFSDTRDLVVPEFYPEPLAPAVAARRSGRPPDLRRVRTAYATLAERHRLVLVEGAGGLVVPIDDDTSMADLALSLHVPLVVVARAGLGTLNHTVLTVAFARQVGLRVLGVVINGYDAATATVADQTNPAEMARMTGLPVLGIVPRLPGIPDPAAAAAAVADHVDCDRLLSLLEEDA